MTLRAHHPQDVERRARRMNFGLKLPAAGASVALQAEQRWRLPVLAALALTIPAFYADMLRESHLWLADLAYVTAAAAVALALWLVARRTPQPMRHVGDNLLDLVLAAGLLAAALLPPSTVSPEALALRMAVALLTLLRMVWAVQHLVTRGGTVYLLVLSFIVLLLCGVGFWWLEPRTPTLADGLWLAFTTAATVGYGDIVPTTPASKIFAVFVVLLGFGVLTLVTAAIATAWIETEERRIEREILHDLRTQVSGLHADLAALRAELRAAAHLVKPGAHGGARFTPPDAAPEGRASRRK